MDDARGPGRDPGDRNAESQTGDTEMFQAFAERRDRHFGLRNGGSSSYRILTLLIGLGVFAGVVWLLLQP